MSSEEYKESDLSKIVKRLMDEEGFEFGEAVREAMEQTKNFESKANGGSIGIEVLFGPKREKFNKGGRTIDSRATTQDFANALKNVSAGTTYQQQADAKRYARNEAADELRAARQGGDVALDNFLKSAGPNMYNRYRSTFTDSRPGTNRQGAFTGAYKMNMDSLLNDLMNKKLQPTSYAAPDPFKKQMDALDAIKAENRRLVNEYTTNNPSTINPDPSLLGAGIAQLNTPGTTPSPPTPAYMDQTLLSQLTKLTPEQATLFDPFDQLSDLDQYNLSQAYPELQSQLRNSSYVSPYGLQGDQELFNRRYGIKDGGRVGLFMGGDPLTGQALQTYNSMKAYGFSDQEIADALSLQRDSASSVEPATATATVPINIINQNQGGDGPNNDPPGPTDPYAGFGYSSANFGLGNTAINKDAVMDYEADAYEIGRTPFGQLSKFGIGALNALKNIPTPINLARMAYESYQQKQIEKKAQEEAIARDIARDMQESNRAGRTGGYQAGYDSDFMDGPSGGGSTGGSPGSSGPGGSDSMGSFARGGLAEMFKKKR